MKIQASTAVLCDAATVREGLLHILGGGVSQLVRPTFPAPFGVDLALIIEFRDLDAVVTSHFVKVGLRKAGTSEDVAAIEVDLQVDASTGRDYQDTTLVLPTRALGLREAGPYEVVVNCDSRILWRKLVWVVTDA